MTLTLKLTGRDLTLHQVAEFLADPCNVTLDDSARAPMQASVDAVHRAANADSPSYGINTGFGAFANRRISADQVKDLQYNLVRSHAAGVGDPFPADIVRLIMLLKANSLATGISGIRPEVVDTLLALLNHDVLPVIPCQGSVGACGDLAPLAHLTLALIGEGEAVHGAKRVEGIAILAAAGREPVSLHAKEGLALLNGTQASAALAVIGLLRAERLLRSAVVIGALSVEASAGSFAPFDDRIQKARRLPGQIRIAELFRKLLTSSTINADHTDCDRVQDPYSLRCMPQVFGSVLSTLRHGAEVLSVECNAVSDNPLIFDDEVISGGNFHAESVAMIADFIGIAVAELANMSERRIDLFQRGVNPVLNMFLTNEPGIECGYMIAHVTAAALASENKTLVHPASADTVPTSAGQEDHVSMAPWAGRKLGMILDNTTRVLAIELLVATHAIDIQAPLRTTAELQAVHDAVRERVSLRLKDRRLDHEIETLNRFIEEGSLLSFLADTGSLLPAN